MRDDALVNLDAASTYDSRMHGEKKNTQSITHKIYPPTRYTAKFSETKQRATTKNKVHRLLLYLIYSPCEEPGRSTTQRKQSCAAVPCLCVDAGWLACSRLFDPPPCPRASLLPLVLPRGKIDRKLLKTIRVTYLFTCFYQYHIQNLFNRPLTPTRKEKEKKKKTKQARDTANPP